MKRHRPVFLKMNGVILVLLLLVILLYSYFSRTSFHAIDTQMTNYNESQLTFLKYQIESNIERLALASSILVRDSSLLDLQISMLTKDYYRMLDYRTHVKEKLNLQSLSSNWSNQLAVYLPTVQTRVSTDLSDNYDPRVLDKAPNGTWTFQPGASPGTAYYQLFMWDPYLSKADSASDPDSVNAVFEVRFGLDNIRKMLQHYKLDSPGSSFLLTSGGRAFSNAEASDGAFETFGAELLKEGLGDGGHRNVSFQGQRLFLSYTYLSDLDAYLIDYVPTEVFYAPIVKSRDLFYASMAVLVVLGLAAAYLLYSNVLKPVTMMMKGLKHVEMGDYSYRIRRRFHNEFDYMVQRFNDMGTQIQHLIQNVYEEQNRSRLATLKQLQSQINPHFLYNCLSFIAGCAKVGLTDKIREMAYHLGGYYRYMTRVENQLPPLKEEVELVTHYLEIYTYRLERIGYEIDIPADLLKEPVMRLVLQPVVENAIVHGIEPTPGTGTIRIAGCREADWIELHVEDSGGGMSQLAMDRLMQRLEQPMDGSTGCGLWNVHQRLRQRFGPGAGVYMQPSESLSGLRVTLRWRSEQEESEEKGERAG